MLKLLHILTLQRLNLLSQQMKDRLEPVIATHGIASFLYARAMRCPFPLGEPAIARLPDYAALYAVAVLQGPFKLGEPAIARNIYSAIHYATCVLGLRENQATEWAHSVAQSSTFP